MSTKTRLKKIISYTIIFSWVFSGLSPIWESQKNPFRVQEAHAITCGFGTDIGGGVCRGFLTTTGSNLTFTSPSDWNNANNTIEVIGAGGSGASSRGSTTAVSTGGGGGAYSSITNFSFATPGTTTATYRIGSGGTAVTVTGVANTAGNVGGDTWFNAAAFPGAGTDNTKVGAKGGSGGLSGAATQVGGAGGVGTSGWGTTRRSGGSGGAVGNAGHTSNATGGGAAAGNANIGGNGGASTGTNAATNGGQANGSGATGGTGQSGAASQTGGNGNNGTEYTSQGSGGGGGGARAVNKNAVATGGTGGAKGGGGGAALIASSNSGSSAISGAGGDGLIVITYTPPNATPTLSISQPDGTSDTVIVGASYNITYTLADTDNVVTAAFYYDTDNTGLNGTAISGACATAAEGTGVTCAWNTTGMTPGSYYVYGVTNDGSNPQVSAYSSGQITINAVSISISITTDGTISYGFVAPGAQKDTTSGSLNDTQTVQNDGNVAEDITIKTTNATGGTQWSLGSSPGSDIFVHEFSLNSGGAWTKFTTANTYQSFITNIGVSSTQNFDLRITAPTSTSDLVQKSLTITLLATQH